MNSKRYKKLPKNTKELPSEKIDVILNTIKSNCTTRFDESIDLSFRINNKQKKNEINLRTVVNLPGGTGKTIKVAVVCDDEKINEAKESKADVVGGDDFTVRGGAADAAIAQKQIMAEQLANEYRIPIVRLIEGTGGGGSVKSLDMDARTYIPGNPGWNWVVDNLSTIPVIALALGPVAGLGAARAVSSHFSIMVEGLSQMFVAGPPVVKRIGEDLTKEELGGSKIHSKNGAIDIIVKSEKEWREILTEDEYYITRQIFSQQNKK